MKHFALADYDRIVEYIGRDTKVFVTPNTLTETSNLLRFGNQDLNTRLFETLKAMIDESKEIFVRSQAASKDTAFTWLGLTDAVLLEAASIETPLLTVDFNLYLEIMKRDHSAAINFYHLVD